MFTISYSVLLRPLPFRADGQLFKVVERSPKGNEDFGVSYPEITQWQQATGDLADVGFAWSSINILDAPVRR